MIQINKTITIKQRSMPITIDSAERTKYIWSDTDKRLYQRVGSINFHDEPGDDNIPTILVDVDGGMLNFRSLIASNTFNIDELPDNFDYNQYVKSL